MPAYGPRPAKVGEGAPIGHKKHGGRAAGVPNKLTRHVKNAISVTIKGLAAEHHTPLELMLNAMRRAVDADDWVEAAKQAAMAAPYVHPRLSSVSVQQKVQIDLSEAQMLREIDAIAREYDLPIVVLDQKSMLEIEDVEPVPAEADLR